MRDKKYGLSYNTKFDPVWDQPNTKRNNKVELDRIFIESPELVEYAIRLLRINKIEKILKNGKI